MFPIQNSHILHHISLYHHLANITVPFIQNINFKSKNNKKCTFIPFFKNKTTQTKSLTIKKTKMSNNREEIV